MNGEHAEFEMLDGYALGTLSKAESERVRAHLATCARCRAQLGELQAVVDVLPHALPPAAAPAELRDRILARLDPAAQPARAWPSALVAGLAAALALALGGDLWLAAQLRSQKTPVVALATAAPATPPATAAPVPQPTRTRFAATPAPRSASPSVDRGEELALRKRVAQLEAALADLRAGESKRDAAERARIAELQSALALARQRAVNVAESPSPQSPQPSVPPQPSELVAALSTGHVYGVDGVVGAEPWHLTIVQPLAGKDALIYTRTPEAPQGQTYRTWVLRGGKTFDAGELPPDAQTKLEMPMPLENGDVVAFSREPVGSGSKPTAAFLMEVTIKQ